MKDIAKIFVYLAAVIILGAVLAPPMYWGGQWLASHGILRVLAEFKFQKYFDRAAMVAALVLLWPLIRSLHIRGWRDLGLEPDPYPWRHLIIGFLIAGLAVAAMAAVYVHLGFYRLRSAPEWNRLLMVALGAVTVGIVEEALFRGAILGLLRRSMRPYTALFWVSALYAIVHFLKPDDRFDPQPVGWLSGFAMIPHAFHQFAEPMTLLAGFTTLFVLGWLCGEAALRTRALWMSIGLHTGVVFVKMSFSILSKRRTTHLPWVGDELQIGLVPVGVLVLACVVVAFLLSHENRRRTATGR